MQYYILVVSGKKWLPGERYEKCRFRGKRNKKKDEKNKRENKTKSGVKRLNTDCIWGRGRQAMSLFRITLKKRLRIDWDKKCFYVFVFF